MVKTPARTKRWLPPVSGRGRIFGRVVWGLLLLAAAAREAAVYELPLAG